jgi:hypothetical protein
MVYITKLAGCEFLGAGTQSIITYGAKKNGLHIVRYTTLAVSSGANKYRVIWNLTRNRLMSAVRSAGMQGM